MNANDSIFYTSLYTFLGTFLLGLVGLLYKSKCKSVKCCGCEINRDTDIELQEDLAQIEQNRNQSVDRPVNNPLNRT